MPSGLTTLSRSRKTKPVRFSGNVPDAVVLFQERAISNGAEIVPIFRAVHPGRLARKFAKGACPISLSWPSRCTATGPTAAGLSVPAGCSQESRAGPRAGVDGIAAAAVATGLLSVDSSHRCTQLDFPARPGCHPPGFFLGWFATFLGNAFRFVSVCRWKTQIGAPDSESGAAAGFQDSNQFGPR